MSYFSDEQRSPRVFAIDVQKVRLKQKLLYGLAHRKNSSFLNGN